MESRKTHALNLVPIPCVTTKPKITAMAQWSQAPFVILGDKNEKCAIEGKTVAQMPHLERKKAPEGAFLRLKPVPLGNGF